MFEKAYRQRLEADLARWEASGAIPAQSANAIRVTLGPQPSGLNIATIVAILGGLLIAAAFLAFVAANWSDIARPLRFVILLLGIAAAYALGGIFARQGRTILADLSVTVGSIVFGAAIALVGQMYHLGEDFAGALLLWGGGALFAAALTASRGALAVALVAACIWSGIQVFDVHDIPHLPFIAFWLVAAIVSLTWHSPAAYHLVAVAALAWWVMTGLGHSDIFGAANPAIQIAAGGGLMLGAGLALAVIRRDIFGAFGAILSIYGAFALALGAPFLATNFLSSRYVDPPLWVLLCGVAGVVLCAVAGALQRRAGPVFAAVAIAATLIVASGLARPAVDSEPWFAYALSLIAMLSLVVSGMLDDERPRLVAGWIGLACVIGVITWAVRGSLLRRSVFLAAAGAIAIGIAILLERFLPKEAPR